MEGRRVRRFGRRRSNNSQTILPLRVRRLSNTISCWYCDFKSSVFNEPVFNCGRRYSKWLRVWFSVGVGFSVTALLGVTLILLLELGRASHLYNGGSEISGVIRGSLFGIFPTVSGYGWSISLGDLGHLCLSTIMSVSAHEFGHALAAASEGIQMEYVAVFLAIFFPGALVAFNHELLQTLSRFAVLRVYCAGIWHNAAYCAVCGISLFLLPLILFPFYIHGENPMVLDVSSDSPLSGYLSPGDLIVSLDGIHIRNANEWIQMITLLDKQTTTNVPYHQSEGLTSVNHGKGYCVPNSLSEESMHIQLRVNQTTCPNVLNPFAAISYLDSSTLDYNSSEDYSKKRRESIYCLNAKDIIKLNKCGSGWAKAGQNSSLLCSEDESCLASMQKAGFAWVEIAYLRPYSLECSQVEEKLLSDNKTSDFGRMNCGGTFVFVGDLISMVQSVRLTSYKPRWPFIFGGNLPNVLEKLLMFIFHVSLALALLNSLPVYFLDGESILEAALCYVSFLSPRNKGLVLQSWLLVGTVSVFLLFARIFLLFL